MAEVTRKDEQSFFKGLKSLFGGVIKESRGDGLLSGISAKARQMLHSNKFGQKVEEIVSRMVGNQRRASSAEMKAEVLEKKANRKLYKAIQHEMKGPVGDRVYQLISENAAYIKTLPGLWANYATEYAAREALKGNRPEDIEKELRKVMPEHITKNLKCIARTECAKANAAIVQARAEALGIRAYIWHSVGDERTRDAHRAMNGILVFYDDPPNPEAMFGGNGYGNYHAGNTFNCRCHQAPVVDISFLPDVVRVHSHGSITSMTKDQILKRYGKIA